MADERVPDPRGSARQATMDVLARVGGTGVLNITDGLVLAQIYATIYVGDEIAKLRGEIAKTNEA